MKEITAKNIEQYKLKKEAIDNKNLKLIDDGVSLMKQKREWDRDYEMVENNFAIPETVRKKLLDKINTIRNKLQEMHEKQVEEPQKDLQDEYEQLQEEIKQVRENLNEQKKELGKSDISEIADVLVSASREIDSYSNKLGALNAEVLNDNKFFKKGIEEQKEFMEKRYTEQE